MPRLIEISPKEIWHETGYCYKFKLPDDCHIGESISSDCISTLQLFENGTYLKMSSSSHDSIRKEGKGRYSHWNRELYFSSTDNSNPIKNGKKYIVIAPLKEGSKIDYSKLNFKDSDFFHYALWKNALLNETELHSIFTFQAVNYLLSSVSYDLKDKIILDVGASPCLGLDLILVLLGAKKVIVNNILPLTQKLPLSFVKNIYFFLKLMGYSPKSPEDVLVIHDDECDLKKEFFAIHGSLSASELKLTEKIDLVLSTFILEHIRDLEQVMKNLYNLSHPSTLHVHAIGARDQTSFHDSLKYLRYTEQILSDGIESFYVNDIEELPICVTEKERESFTDKYKSLSLKELSAQIFVFYARKE